MHDITYMRSCLRAFAALKLARIGKTSQMQVEIVKVQNAILSVKQPVHGRNVQAYGKVQATSTELT